MKTGCITWGLVRGLEPLSLCDWPGRVSAVLFLGGCNLRCPTCHNWELAWFQEKMPALGREEVMTFLSSRGKWLDGLVVTGGEPTCAPCLAEWLEELHILGLPIKLDSNGMRPEVIEHLVEEGLVAGVSVDVKGPWEKYPELTGRKVDPETARACLTRIFALAQKHPGVFRFRTTLVPALDRADLDTVRSYLPKGHTLTTQEFVPPKIAVNLARARREQDFAFASVQHTDQGLARRTYAQAN